MGFVNLKIVTMAKKTKKDNEEVVAQPVASTQNPYQNDPEVKQEASGDMIFTANPSARSRMADEGDDDITFTGEGESDADTPSIIPTTTNKVEDDKEDYGDEQDPVLGGAKATPDTKVTTTQPKKGSLYDIEATAVSNAAGAKSRYDAAYDALKDEYKAMADLLKPKDRTEEQKRLRNVALAQAIGQGLAAIFGGIYANSKKGRGRIVLPEDFASKTLAKAEELREKGLLDEQNYKKLLGDLRLRTADLELKRSGEDYAAAQGEINRARQAIQSYEQEQRNRDFQREQSKSNQDFQREQTASNQNFQREQTASNQNFQREQAKQSHQRNIQLKNMDTQIKNNGVFAGVDDETISVAKAFLPKTRSEARKVTNEDGTTQHYYESVPIQSWTDEEYRSALNQAKMLKSRLGTDYNTLASLLREKGKTWDSVKIALDNNYTAAEIIASLKK